MLGWAFHLDYLKGKYQLETSDRERIDLTLNKYLDPATLNSNLEVPRLAEISYYSEHSAIGTGGPQQVNEDGIRQHTVKEGETLSGIADQYGMSSGSLVIANPDLKDTEIIQIGQILNIPDQPASPEELAKEREARQQRLASKITRNGTAKTGLRSSAESYLAPVSSYHVSQYFSYSHKGIDMAAAYGTPIKATKSGCMISVTGGWNGGYGNLIIQNLGGGVTAWYAHLSKFTVNEGECVDRGEIIGYVGSTGRSTGNHLHFELRSGGIAFNPKM